MKRWDKGVTGRGRSKHSSAPIKTAQRIHASVQVTYTKYENNQRGKKGKERRGEERGKGRKKEKEERRKREERREEGGSPAEERLTERRGWRTEKRAPGKGIQ